MPVNPRGKPCGYGGKSAGSYQPGAAHTRYKGGYYTTAKGYLRQSQAPKKYQHRLVMESLCSEFCYYPPSPKSSIPSGFTVEHVDHNKQHNCYHNLLLLDVRIHRHISWASWLSTPQIGEVPGQELPSRGLDDYDPTISLMRYTKEELEEVPF